MRRAASLAALGLVALGVLAVACGRYGAPHRIKPEPPAPASAPVTDPAVSR